MRSLAFFVGLVVASATLSFAETAKVYVGRGPAHSHGRVRVHEWPRSHCR